MGLFDKLKKKNYLKRTDFINFVDSNKIWSKSMTLDEIKELLEFLKNEISKYEFDIDKNFIMNSRRKGLKSNIEERLLKNDGNKNELVLESVFNFWEIVGDEYFGDFISISKDLGLSVQELTRMDNEYRKKGIICIQERDIILEIIDSIINYINERGV
ncbi:MAG: hypothetical protein E7172_06710 [Firmicutes bacterium]|nr:hypothetical protein [Bacillota bacterium]